MKIVFIGTPEFSVTILKGLISGGFKPVLVITETDTPVGRKQIITPPPVKALAQEHNIPVEQPIKIGDCKLKIENLKPDLIVIAAYGQIIPKTILDIPRHGCLNVHPSLLPRWRGPSPIQYAILNGDKKTGVTIILIDEKTDHGPILSQREIIIDEDEAGKTLYEKLADLGARLLLETIFQVERGLLKAQPQDEEKAIYSKILSREDGKINWRKTAEDIKRQIRAFELWPESFTFWQSTRKMLKIKILKARILESKEGITYPIGKTLVVPQNQICVQCGKGLLRGERDFLVIEKLQLEGKKEMASEEFLRGHLDFIGTILK
ncbi:MAG TPA: methionyl-tRNA formyltransferase [Candidatus Humimicrobiaceae bacterium]|nr:methionyl-tRNA formyltransferase [Candidatus Humimicrobiaceae bacterium]